MDLRFGDPAGQVLSVGEPAGRTRPVGRPYDTWLCQMDRLFAGVGMGRVAAWRMAIRRPKEVDASNVLLRRMLPLIMTD